jgi:hypothetical protein
MLSCEARLLSGILSVYIKMNSAKMRKVRKVRKVRKISKQEAIAALDAGLFIAHQSFEEHEYIAQTSSGYLRDERGEPLFDFWHYFKGAGWETGWVVRSLPYLKKRPADLLAQRD